MNRCTLLSTALLILQIPHRAADADYVWWEGEQFAASTFPTNKPFGPKSLDGNAHLLSNGDWLNATGKGGGAAPTAAWNVALPMDGEYAFWVRKFWKHGPFKWRFDSMPAGEWRTCGPNVALADDTPLKKHVNANWVSLGSVTLPKGERTFEVELITEPGKDWGAAFDCFVLARGAFTPNGNVRPGVKSGKADEGYFPFEPEVDRFDVNSLLDLRSLNEKVAGESGFLKRNGNQITLGNGTPVRFWAVNVGIENAQQDRKSVDYLARKLAKLGVNMVRFHSPLWDEKNPTRLDPQKLDALHYLVTAMKREGIYTAVSFCFPTWIDGEKLGLDGFAGFENKRPFAVLFFDPKFQAMHREWCRQLLTSPNPHAGTPLGQDPAVGMVEIINEDSLFFWTFGKKIVPSLQWLRLEQRYTQWLTRKYGSLAAARHAWGNESAPGDAGDRAALYEVYHLTTAGLNQGGNGKRTRAGDQVQFLAELQRGFYADTTQFLKTDLKFGGLVVPSNWTTADAATLLAAERWTYTAADMVDSHGYFDPEHKGDGAAYSVRVGHTFQDAAGVKAPGSLPLRFQQNADFPQIVSEINFTQPNRYRVDMVPLAAMYGALQGVDGIFFFSVKSNYLRDTSIQKFQVASPAVAQQFPAGALMYRRGLVRESEPAVHQVVPTEDIWAMKPLASWSPNALDQLRAQDVPLGAKVTGSFDKIDGLTPYVGPVVRSFGSDASGSFQRDLPRHLDRQGQAVLSLTGELRWDFGKGVAVVNTPKAQGATGFLAAAATVQTADLSIAVTNEYASVLAVSMDDLPLSESRSVLVQLMTRDQLAGFRADGGKITSLGSAPFGVQEIGGSIELRQKAGAAAANVVALDPNGYALPTPVMTNLVSGKLRLSLLPDVLYYLVTK